MRFKIVSITLLFFSASALASLQESCSSNVERQHTHYVATNGKDKKSHGSITKPWKTINYAVRAASDNSLIVVKPGIYKEKIKIKRAFKEGMTLRSQIPYKAKLTENQRVIALINNASNISIEGFEITHINNESRPLVVHIDAGGKNKVKHITLRNNIIHDSYNNDLLKINFGAEHITVICNMFYNQGNSDEHIDVNSASNVVIKNNIFFNDFAKSNRPYTKKSSSFITVKDSNGDLGHLLGAEKVIIDGNIFFNWQGSHGFGFVLIGEDGKPFYEAFDIHIFNNLFLGNSEYSMRSPLGIKGAKDVYFYNNTITGDLPSNAYAIRVSREGKNLTPKKIVLHSNIWADNTGTMGQGEFENFNDFSDTLPTHIDTFILNGNIYWNGGKDIPSSFFDSINYSDDQLAVIKNPHLPDAKNIRSPAWNSSEALFYDKSLDIEQVFNKLLLNYGIPNTATNKASRIDSSKADIINNIRITPKEIGAFQSNTLH